MSCPTPSKQRHRSRKAALAAVKSLHRSQPGLVSPDLVAYRCECGAWHAGHSQASLGRRISRALKGRRA